jgi:hypothetical protein
VLGAQSAAEVEAETGVVSLENRLVDHYRFVQEEQIEGPAVDYLVSVSPHFYHPVELIAGQ